MLKLPSLKKDIDCTHFINVKIFIANLWEMNLGDTADMRDTRIVETLSHCVISGPENEMFPWIMIHWIMISEADFIVFDLSIQTNPESSVWLRWHRPSLGVRIPGYKNGYKWKKYKNKYKNLCIWKYRWQYQVIISSGGEDTFLSKQYWISLEIELFWFCSRILYFKMV